MIIFLKKIKNALLTILSFIKKDLITLNNLGVLIKVFLIRTIYTYPNIREKYKENFKREIKFIQNNLALSNLDKFGFHEPELMNSYDATNLKNKLAEKYLNISNLNESAVQSISNEGGRINKVIDTKESFIKKIFYDERILDIAKNYLRTKKLTIRGNILFSTKASEASHLTLSKNAQMFHTDNDYRRFLKIFVYLNDVNYDNGPHEYVIGTHKQKKSENTLIRRFDDIEIKKNYPNQIKTFIGKQGKYFFADTFGLHKGCSVEKGYRFILVIEYGSDLIKYHKFDNFI